MLAGQITTLTFFRYKTLFNKIWAFGMMQFAHPKLSKVEGQTFYKLLGSGKVGFNPMPDWTVYALLQVWENEEKAERFFAASKLMDRYRKRSDEHWILYMKNKISRGRWAGNMPFSRHPETSESIPYVAAITRATIKFKYLRKFWKSVPASQSPLKDNPGLIYTKGIGEVPFLQMATFSLWKDQQSLDAFAYRSREHIRVIGDTRKLGWYREELFSRFQPYRFEGSWNGVDIGALKVKSSDQSQR
ncbi:hypothetical protein GCM10011361_07960 [Muriicola marianensis]|uniref:DUF3291 domain-containing protein n=1 Tax=Muriicola marianensis TaxID=1324801 RepID=A0ABQ1QUU5_9FLAO|nr:DUF3291 domain-containing protein [Muriicola marianensis]GGD43419.1 hypothetical protein GCM10011361_07960 [Muriicola marianensis]